MALVAATLRDCARNELVDAFKQGMLVEFVRDQLGQGDYIVTQVDTLSKTFIRLRGGGHMDSYIGNHRAL